MHLVLQYSAHRYKFSRQIIVPEYLYLYENERKQNKKKYVPDAISMNPYNSQESLTCEQNELLSQLFQLT